MTPLFNEILYAIQGRCISDESASVAAAEVVKLVEEKFTATNNATVNLTRYSMSSSSPINVFKAVTGGWVKIEDVETSHTSDVICNHWMPNEAECAFFGACNCTDAPCRNKRH